MIFLHQTSILSNTNFLKSHSVFAIDNTDMECCSVYIGKTSKAVSSSFRSQKLQFFFVFHFSLASAKNLAKSQQQKISGVIQNTGKINIMAQVERRASDYERRETESHRVTIMIIYILTDC